MYRNRTEELQEYINLYKHFSKPEASDILRNIPLEPVSILQDFFKREIESLSKDLINYMVKSNQIDKYFADEVFKYDQQFFEKVLKEVFQKTYEPSKLHTFLQIVRNLRTFAQAIRGYEALYDQIGKHSNSYQEQYQLSMQITEMRSMPLFTKLPVEEKKRVWNMTTSLPLNCESLDDHFGVLISNLGNGCHMNIGNKPDRDGVMVSVLTFDARHEIWKVKRTLSENNFEFVTGDNLILCMVTPGPERNRMETVLKSRELAATSKWTIQLYDETDKSKGHTIKVAGQNAYLCAGPLANFKYLVQVEKDIDSADSARFTWKFMSAWQTPK